MDLSDIVYFCTFNILWRCRFKWKISFGIKCWHTFSYTETTHCYWLLLIFPSVLQFICFFFTYWMSLIYIRDVISMYACFVCENVKIIISVSFTYIHHACVSCYESCWFRMQVHVNCLLISMFYLSCYSILTLIVLFHFKNRKWIFHVCLLYSRACSTFWKVVSIRLNAQLLSFDFMAC